MMPTQGPPKLIRALDRLVRRDPGPVELSGSIVVAVKGEAEAWFWHAVFSGRRLLGCGPLQGVPRDTDAILVFDEAQAAAVIEGHRPKGQVATFGRHDLLEAFIDRYCTFHSGVDVRVLG